ncbi:hypothetical protein PLESTB_000031300 [Pleodorina starrii]|uniref:RRM domain-containing protein n=1 Tax=Pleodorina starrii TaxID=330485 RepID=A0A9W6B9V3_9CHLO|nr:hypothetical protein PLESTM_001103000 [Pleodorina starrii]GLC47840.1 hypothetical protein PLESTB_000031300 [Pleodorina starrii]GLC70735.1 hypothetical protein PLESTF_001027800 [Pleodorina starrii]
MSERPDRPVFIGNFEYDAEEKDIVRLMEKYGPVDKIDMKQGFAFVYMRYKEDGDEAVRRLDRTEWGYKRRQLRVEWAQKTEADRKRDTRPSKTLFVVNFDVRRTTERDIERFFSRYGRLMRVQIKKNYSFVQFADVESAVRAMERCNGAQMEGRTLAVEYVQNEDPNIRVPDFGRDDRDYGRDRERDFGRDRDRSRDRGYRGRERSRSRSRSRGRRSPERSPPRYERRASPPPRGRSRSPVPERRDRSPSYER